MLDTDDTIVALASAVGGSPRGVIRLSGAGIWQALEPVFQPNNGQPLPTSGPPLAIDGELILDQLGAIPAHVYLWPTCRSYTRQPTAELHTIGSQPILDATIKTLCQAANLRPAQPGEFTLRAFLAGRLDLTQAEAVLGVIDARHEDDLQQALRQLSGGLVHPLQAARNQLLDAVAHLEAGLDFVEEDIEFISEDELRRLLLDIGKTLADIQEQLDCRKDASSLCRIVVFGLPNGGKSSLVNALADSDVALVSDRAGTTRDYLIRKVKIGDHNCQLVDTAGVESVSEGLESMAQTARVEQQNEADLRILCIDLSRSPDEWERQHLVAVDQQDRMIVGTKADITSTNITSTDTAGMQLQVSSLTGQGIAELRSKLAAWLDTRPRGRPPLLETAARCQANLSAAREAIERAVDIHNTRGGEELVAMELRTSLEEIGQIVGVVYTDDILDRVFSRFCIGK